MKTTVRQKLSPSLVFLPVVSPLELSSSLVACNCFYEKVLALVFESKLMIAYEQVRENFFPGEMAALPPRKIPEHALVSLLAG